MAKKKVFEKFDSVHEFLNAINKRQVRESFEQDQCSQSNDAYWTGTNDYQQATNLFMYGDKANADKLNIILKKIKAQGKGNETRNNLYNSPCGFLPIVPKVLAGDPQNMLAIRKQTYKSTKIINLVYSMSCAGNVSAEAILSNSVKLVEVICQLEKNGYRINLYTGDNAELSRAETAFIIKIKDAGKYLDTLKIAYPLINPSFLRRHAFRWMETNQQVDARGDYGRAMEGHEFREFLKDKFKNAVILSFYDIYDRNTDEIKEYIENAK